MDPLFGRNENGEFVLTDKSGFVRKGGEGRTTDPNQNKIHRVKAESTKTSRQNRICKQYGRRVSVFEKAVSEDFRGYFKGDLLYYNTILRTR